MPIETTEETLLGGNTSHIKVLNKNDDQIDLYAAKVVLSRPLWKGQLNFGSEYSYSHHAYQAHCDQTILGPDADADTTIYGARQLNTDKHIYRSFYTHVVYRFNAASNKYKGSGAGESQKARMKN